MKKGFCAAALMTSSVILADCATTSFAERGGNPPANYRKQIAEFMKTQKGDFLGISPHPVRPGQNVEIADPKPKPIGQGFQVCVRVGHTDVLFGGQGYIRVYGFDGGGKLDTGTGNAVEGAFYLLMFCGNEPVWKPFPEAQVKAPQT